MLRHARGYQLANRGVDTRSLQAYLGQKRSAHENGGRIFLNLGPVLPWLVAREERSGRHHQPGSAQSSQGRESFVQALFRAGRDYEMRCRIGN